MRFSLIRAKILSAIKENEPISITDLSKIVGISKGSTIYRYLEELEKKGLITTKKENKKRGKPTLVSTTKKADPFKFEHIDKTIKSVDDINKLLKG